MPGRAIALGDIHGDLEKKSSIEGGEKEAERERESI